MPDSGDATDDIEWTTALAERILRTSTLGRHRIIQALVAEGGPASIDKLVDTMLRSATQSLNMAARREGIIHHLPDQQLIQAHRYPNPLTSKVAAYSLPAESVRRSPQQSASWTNYTAKSNPLMSSASPPHDCGRGPTSAGRTTERPKEPCRAGLRRTMSGEHSSPDHRTNEVRDRSSDRPTTEGVQCLGTFYCPLGITP
jgi:hypothetical protein